MKDCWIALAFVAICATLAAVAYYMRRCVTFIERMVRIFRHVLKGIVRVFTRT